jgi:hypothetical protein
VGKLRQITRFLSVERGTNAAFRFNGSKTMFSVPMRSENTFYGLYTAEKMFSCRQLSGEKKEKGEGKLSTKSACDDLTH